MEPTSLSELRIHLSAYVARVEQEHERFLVTRNGHASVVLVSTEDWESLEETLFWLSQAGVRQDVDQAREDEAAG